MRPLSLALNNEPVSTPYLFKSTGIYVFSFEEALFHCYYHWHESLDDYISPSFINWVSDELGHYQLAARIRELSEPSDNDDNVFSDNGFSARYSAFLQLVPYFDIHQIERLKYELDAWESVTGLEKLLRLADAQNECGNVHIALELYQRALKHEQNPRILNNTAICLMKTGKPVEAFDMLERAVSTSADNIDIVLNFTEAAILSHSFNKAAVMLDKLTKLNDMAIVAHVNYLHGELNFEFGDYKTAAEYYKKSLLQTNDDFYRYRLSEAYVRLRLYNEASSILEEATENRACLIRKAEVCKARGHIPAAVKYIERAVVTNSNDAELWTLLASYHRMNYNHQKAKAAIMTAINITGDNPQVLIERARIHKAMGDTKEYRSTLRNILRKMRADYRKKTTVTS